MLKPNNEYFNLTVDTNGLVSLWDSADKAHTGKQPGEVVVRLPLTQHQQKLIARATALAQSKRDNQMVHDRLGFGTSGD